MKRLNQTTIYFILTCVFLLAVNASLGFILTKQSNTAMRSLMENRMLDLSNTAASMIDGDVLKNVKAEDINTPEYQDILGTLTHFDANIGLEYIYCIRDMGDGTFVFTIDPDAESPGTFGEHITYTDALYRASQGTPSVDKEPYEDDWGRFYSAYSPVFDSEHNVAGIVAVDFNAEWFDGQVSRQLRTTVLIGGISIIFAAAIVVLITTRYRKQLKLILGEMNQVSDGIETLVCTVSPGTEIIKKKQEPDHPSSDEIKELGKRIQSLEKQLSDRISFVRAQAYVDALTGVGNRTAYEDYVKTLDESIKGGKAAFTVAVLDLNGLKELNDSYGHEAGDIAITFLASVLCRAFGKERLYRIGGDEFVVILDGARPDIESRLNSVDDELIEKKYISVSKGFTTFDPDTDMRYRDVFKRADDMMYDDKRAYYLSHKDRRRKQI